MQIIIYGSHYGSTRQYALQLAKTTCIEAVNFKEAKSLDKYDQVIYMGAIYAGGVMGLKKTAEKLSPNQTLIIITVGLADPTDSCNIENIRKSIKETIPSILFDEKRIFHLRGAIDYKNLNLSHRLLLSMVHSKMSKIPEDELDAVGKTMLATYEQTVDFVDFESLEKIWSLIKSETLS